MTDPKTLSTLLGELDAKVEGARNLPTHVERIRAYTYLCHDLPDILTTLREGIERLERALKEAIYHVDTKYGPPGTNNLDRHLLSKWRAVLATEGDDHA